MKISPQLANTFMKEICTRYYKSKTTESFYNYAHSYLVEGFLGKHYHCRNSPQYESDEVVGFKEFFKKIQAIKPTELEMIAINIYKNSGFVTTHIMPLGDEQGQTTTQRHITFENIANEINRNVKNEAVVDFYEMIDVYHYFAHSCTSYKELKNKVNLKDKLENVLNASPTTIRKIKI